MVVDRADRAGRAEPVPEGDRADLVQDAERGDRIRLTGLRVRGRHGVLPAERRDGQDFLVDVALSLDLRPAAATDDLADTVDYGALAQALATVVGGEPLDLLETLAWRLAEVCLTDSRVSSAEVTVHKPAAPLDVAFTDVSVTVVRP